MDPLGDESIFSFSFQFSLECRVKQPGIASQHPIGKDRSSIFIKSKKNDFANDTVRVTLRLHGFLTERCSAKLRLACVDCDIGNFIKTRI